MIGRLLAVWRNSHYVANNAINAEYCRAICYLIALLWCANPRISGAYFQQLRKPKAVFGLFGVRPRQPPKKLLAGNFTIAPADNYFARLPADNIVVRPVVHIERDMTHAQIRRRNKFVPV